MTNRIKKLMLALAVVALSANSVSVNAGAGMMASEGPESAPLSRWQRFKAMPGAAAQRVRSTVASMSPAQRAAALTAMVGLLVGGTAAGVHYQWGLPYTARRERFGESADMAEADFMHRTFDGVGLAEEKGTPYADWVDPAKKQEEERQEAARKKIRDDKGIDEDKRQAELAAGSYEHAATPKEVQQVLVGEISDLQREVGVPTEQLSGLITRERELAKARLLELAGPEARARAKAAREKAEAAAETAAATGTSEDAAAADTAKAHADAAADAADAADAAANAS